MREYERQIGEFIEQKREREWQKKGEMLVRNDGLFSENRNSKAENSVGPV